jgi:hypothetical protein
MGSPRGWWMMATSSSGRSPSSARPIPYSEFEPCDYCTIDPWSYYVLHAWCVRLFAFCRNCLGCSVYTIRIPSYGVDPQLYLVNYGITQWILCFCADPTCRRIKVSAAVDLLSCVCQQHSMAAVDLLSCVCQHLSMAAVDFLICVCQQLIMDLCP